jgi:hypothetical protein
LAPFGDLLQGLDPCDVIAAGIDVLTWRGLSDSLFGLHNSPLGRQRDKMITLELSQSDPPIALGSVGFAACYDSGWLLIIPFIRIYADWLVRRVTIGIFS